ncbi:MAG: asparagine synthase (glutamine-hydrolyzing) [Candidatus Diapherotrites archaeon]|nr:asparagine synthase (glutamine-hydrolyzing) [Candidatus Diapherotrites archaeon]
MCGICGYFGLEDKTLLNAMTNALSHRGPDGEGFFTDKNIGLGYRRLSIIDTTKREPIIHNEDQSIFLAFNGEIYNYKALRMELQKKGHSFYTQTDSETIVHTYEEWGPACVERLQGMFAIALWDANRKQVFLARDRLGIKPLYYYYKDDMLVFASEAKSILQARFVQRVPNKNVLADYLAYRYVPGPATFFQGIQRVQPGTYLLASSKGLQIKEYWNPYVKPSFNGSMQGAAMQLNALLGRTVESHLQSDVPLGVFLSGGLDSSAIVSYMHDLVPEHIETFSISFEEDPQSEAQKARRVAEHFETKHHSFIPPQKELRRLPEIVYHLDEPIADAVIASKYLLSEYASKKVKVVLTGEGGDEAFGGYSHYKVLSLMGKYPFAFSKGPLNSLARRVVRHAPLQALDNVFQYSTSIGVKGKARALQFLDPLNSTEQKYLDLVSLFDAKDMKELGVNTLNPPLSAQREALNSMFARVQGPLTHKAMVRETTTWLPDYILLQQDKLAMAFGLEGRVPFVDHKVMEFSLSLPPSFKVQDSNEKAVFRRAVKNRVPRFVFEAKKFPFSVPLTQWLNGELGEIARSILTDFPARERGLFKPEYVEGLFRARATSPLILDRQIWSLLVLELWHRTFIDPDEIHPPKKLEGTL